MRAVFTASPFELFPQDRGAAQRPQHRAPLPGREKVSHTVPLSQVRRRSGPRASADAFDDCEKLADPLESIDFEDSAQSRSTAGH